MTNEIAKKEGAKPIAREEITPELLKTKLDEIRKTYSNPDHLDGETNLLIEFRDLLKTQKPTKEQEKRKTETERKVCFIYGLENGIWAATLSHQRDYASLARIRQKIIKEYDCKNALELMLADAITACYWRIMKKERIINLLSEREDHGFSFDQIKINALKELNHEVDSANRRLNMNIILLKEMKQPALKVNIKTNNAFIGDNQQFNNNVENNEAK